MIHPSYSEVMETINREAEADDMPVVSSRYSIVLATSKRARQIIDGAEPKVDYAPGKKALSIAVDEVYKGEVKIYPGEETEE